MNKTTTLNDLAHFTQQEEELLASFGLSINEPKLQPKQSTIDNILNYSKALSIRKSKMLGTVENVLN